MALAFVVAGILAGAFSGLLGVGGAALATPLVRFLGLSPYLAIGTTVPVILPTTATGAWTYLRAGLVDMRAAAWTAASGAVAAVAGALTTRRVDGHSLMLATAGVLFVLGLRTLIGRPTGDRPAEPRPSPGPLLALGAVAGFVSGLLGIGGGFLLVPVFIRVFQFPVKLALGTSLAAITLTVFPNIIAQALVGNVDWGVAALLAVGVIPGARIGAAIAVLVPDQTLRTMVSVCVVAVALAYAAVELAALSSA